MSSYNPYEPGTHGPGQAGFEDFGIKGKSAFLILHFLAFVATFFVVRIAANFYLPAQVALVSCILFWLPHACVSLFIVRVRDWTLAFVRGSVGSLATWLGIGAISWATNDRWPHPLSYPIPFILLIATIPLGSAVAVEILANFLPDMIKRTQVN